MHPFSVFPRGRGLLCTDDKCRPRPRYRRSGVAAFRRSGGISAAGGSFRKNVRTVAMRGIAAIVLQKLGLSDSGIGGSQNDWTDADDVLYAHLRSIPQQSGLNQQRPRDFDRVIGPFFLRRLARSTDAQAAASAAPKRRSGYEPPHVCKRSGFVPLWRCRRKLEMRGICFADAIEGLPSGRQLTALDTASVHGVPCKRSAPESSRGGRRLGGVE